MIRYSLTCSDGHSFDSWFASTEAFEALDKAGHLACAVCGTNRVRKSLMAPSVRSDAAAPARPLAEPASDAQRAAASVRRHVEDNFDYVGLSFAREARAIHSGEAPERAIFGEAKAEEAKQLVEDGVPVGLLPFTPRSRTN